jgi:hypothetical protein
MEYTVVEMNRVNFFQRLGLRVKSITLLNDSIERIYELLHIVEDFHSLIGSHCQVGADFQFVACNYEGAELYKISVYWICNQTVGGGQVGYYYWKNGQAVEINGKDMFSHFAKLVDEDVFKIYLEYGTPEIQIERIFFNAFLL